MELTRKTESLLRSLRTRHGRRKSGCCLCEGVRATGELFLRRPELVRFTVATERGAAAMGNIPGELCIVTEEKFAEFSATVNSQGVLAVASVPPEPGCDQPPQGPFLLALDRLGDPGNFGTICRTLRSTGLTELWYTRGSVDPYGDKAVRSALGAQFALSLRSFENLETLRQQAARFGYPTVYLTDPRGLFPLFRPLRPLGRGDRRGGRRRFGARWSRARHHPDAGQLRVAQRRAGRDGVSV